MAIAAVMLVGSPSTANAADEAFTKGPVFTTFGPAAAVDTDMSIPAGTQFAIAFDAVDAARPEETNRKLITAGRFMNMHVAAGVPQDDIKLAIVVHGKAAFDMTQDNFYSRQYDGSQNASKYAVKALTGEGVRIIICGQTARYHGIEKTDLLPGVEMALSAMTAHALLAQDGYTLNPF
ncbi:DsrE family protein [Fretibacter rubidus]|uniref:DsrE family protein n=1 Tax=Fretibacter rubidus TaxID=570162 RepID=UPI003529F41B